MTVKTVNDGQQRSTMTINDKRWSMTINKGQSTLMMMNDSQQQSTMINNVLQQLTKQSTMMVNNGQQWSTMVNNSKQQLTSCSGHSRCPDRSLRWLRPADRTLPSHWTADRTLPAHWPATRSRSDSLATSAAGVRDSGRGRSETS